MHAHYEDILARIPEPPKWFDENAVPRWCRFSPGAVADIYAVEVALAEIACQSCRRPFLVAFSYGRMEQVLGRGAPLETLVRSGGLHYGDPPNVHCCPAGPTMNSDPVRVVEFWTRKDFEWVRRPDLEIALDDEPGD